MSDSGAIVARHINGKEVVERVRVNRIVPYSKGQIRGLVGNYKCWKLCHLFLDSAEIVHVKSSSLNHLE